MQLYIDDIFDYIFAEIKESPSILEKFLKQEVSAQDRTLYATHQFAGGNGTNEPQLKAMLKTELQQRKAQRDLFNHERILPRSRSREAERDRDRDREGEERRLEYERIDAELREEMRLKEQTAREEQLRTQKQVEQRQTKALSAKERYLQRQSQGTEVEADLQEK